jgi:hypothetical protein
MGLQLWTWFVGMLVVTLPWHVVGIMGQPRRMSYYDYSDPALAPQAPVCIPLAASEYCGRSRHTPVPAAECTCGGAIPMPAARLLIRPRRRGGVRTQ